MNKKMIDFVKECGTFYLASSEGSDARVRPFGFIAEFNGKIYFATGKQKNIYKQLNANPNFEICACLQDGSKWIRIKAQAVFEDNLEIKQKAFQAAPVLADVYGSPASPIFTMFYADNIKASIYSMAGGIEKII